MQPFSLPNPSFIANPHRLPTLSELLDVHLQQLRAAMPEATMPEMIAAVKAAREMLGGGTGTVATATASENAKLKARVAELEAAASAPSPAPKAESVAALKSLTLDQLQATAARLLAENATLKVAATKPAGAMTMTERAQAAVAAAAK